MMIKQCTTQMDHVVIEVLNPDHKCFFCENILNLKETNDGVVVCSNCGKENKLEGKTNG